MATITTRGTQQIPGESVQPRATIQATTTQNRPISQSNISQENTEEIAETDPKPAVTLSPQLSALARKEQAFRAQLQKFEADKKVFEQEKGNFLPKSSIQERLKGGKASEAIKDALGVDYNELTSILLAEQNGADPNAERINSLAQQVEDLKNSQTEKEKNQTDAVIKQYQGDIKTLVSGSTEYEAIQAEGEEGLEFVLQHILDTFEQDKEILTVEQAAKEVEDALLEKAAKYAGLKKVQQKLKLKPELEETEVPPKKQTLPPPKVQANPPSSQEPVALAPMRTKQSQHLTQHERLQLAIQRAQAKQQR